MSDQNDLAKYLLQNPKYFIELIGSESPSQRAGEDGYEIPENFAKYLNDAVEKIRTFIRDQTHVLELKAAQSAQKALWAGHVMGPNSGGNGAAGTGW